LYPVLIEGLRDLLFPVRAKFGDSSCQCFSKLVEQLSTDLVPRRCRGNGRAKIPKRNGFEHADRGLGPIEPDRLAHRGEHLLGDSDDRVAVTSGAPLCLSRYLLFGERAANRGETALGKLLCDRALLWRIRGEELIAVLVADKESRWTGTRRSLWTSRPRRMSGTGRRRWPAGGLGRRSGSAAKLRSGLANLGIAGLTLPNWCLAGFAISAERSRSRSWTALTAICTRPCAPASRRCASTPGTLTVPGVTPTPTTIVLTDEGCRDRLEASRSRTKNLNPLRLGRATFARKDRNDRDAVHLEICLDTQHLTDATMPAEHRVGNQPARLKCAGSAPSPVAIVSRGGEFNIHATSHCAGEASR
jgi:hypothetical protein